jgi:hypothetical protein
MRLAPLGQPLYFFLESGNRIRKQGYKKVGYKTARELRRKGLERILRIKPGEKML